MALMTKNNGKKSTDDDADEPRVSRAIATRSKKADLDDGFFTVRKRGQGYWTRMFTALGAALFVALTANFLYNDVLLGFSQRTRFTVIGIFCVAGGLLLWWLINREQSVEFLIATDSEMKKVNWTTREELIGSTKVVIIFMFFIAAFLFGTDLIFGKLFQVLTILKFGPFG
jgi:preprotein translocase SecE subunit